MTDTVSYKTEPRYKLLDGLRGVAAILVICYHFGEGFATSALDQMMNHGYLAVDFFFVLSGFVIGYAYQNRWSKGLTVGRFMLRRVIRLQPMVVLSVVLGALSFMMQGSVKWDGTAVPLHLALICLVLSLFLIPAAPGAPYEIRGNGEMFPLNGPAWSLFFEYIGNAVYALWLRRLGTRGLAAFVAVCGAGLAAWAVCNMSGTYNIGVGWSMLEMGWLGGLLRVGFSFSAGLLIQRVFKPRYIRGAFWLCAVVLFLVFACPYVGGTDEPSVWNGIYDAVAALVVFPTIVYVAASGNTTDALSGRVCEFLGQLSYPVYIIHYPVMYLFYHWVWTNNYTLAQVWPVCIGLFVLIVAMAWFAMKFYDTPVRRWLGSRLLTRGR